ncbi:MAG: signal recognition particle-docking protein FtsY [Phycisphaerales bacterium]|nr:signal recognition particle-docking protein FtsY [Phycisphaerales bacterium]
MGLFSSTVGAIKKGLSRTRDSFVGGLRSLLRGRKLSEDVIDEIESRLIQADVGVRTTTRLIEHLREQYRAGKVTQGEQVIGFLKTELKSYWPAANRQIARAACKPTVILVAGINGAGKTTSVAKIAKSLLDEKRSVMLAACDTFRAGAVNQLTIWSQRLGVPIIKGQQNSDPASVAFDACEAAMARGVDVLVIDTAGRLHTQDPLMKQLIKIRDVVAKRIAGAPHEVLLVLDATTGQNAIEQAKKFKEAINVTGIFLAKLDGTAKGGIVIAIREAVDIPVKLIGVGESPEDVEPFDPETFIESMFAE